MTSHWINYFGYGSLVNRETRPPDEVANTARLKGWRRVWEHRVTDPNRDKPCTSLSVEPLSAGEAGSIDGVIVSIPPERLAQLDEREAGYERLALPATLFDLPEGFIGEKVMVYRSLPENRALADAEHPILQSYIDCVMAGYLNRFEQPGLEALMNSTRGWDRTILNDRDDPFYPRWVAVDEARCALFDEYIGRASLLAAS